MLISVLNAFLSQFNTCTRQVILYKKIDAKKAKILHVVKAIEIATEKRITIRKGGILTCLILRTHYLHPAEHF